MSCAYENAANTKKECAKQRDIALADEIIEVPNKGTHRRDGKRVCCGQPSNDRGISPTNLFRNEREAASNEVQRNLRTYQNVSRAIVASDAGTVPV
jgi:hypothetical protein